MQAWVQGEWMALDFETTGVDPREARPVEVAWLIVDREGQIVHEYCTLINAEVEIPEEARKVHGITTERVREEGRTVAEVFSILYMSIQNNLHLPLVIYNVPYDWPLFKAESARQSWDIPYTPLFLDPLLLDRVSDKYRKGSRNLSTTAEVHGVKLENAHSARADAHAAALIMQSLIKKTFGELALEELQVKQSHWYDDWKVSINAYWKSQGKDQEVKGGWPE